VAFAWGEDKNRTNIAKHGVSFDDACRIFDGFTVDWVDDRFEYGETREVRIGLVNGICFLSSSTPVAMKSAGSFPSDRQ